MHLRAPVPNGRYVLLLFALALLSTMSLTLHAQGNGRITGRVDAADTKVALPGAQITIVGSTLSTVTGEGGQFSLSRVPAGTHTLRAAYLGREPQTRQITVTANGTVDVVFTLEAVSLTAVMVRASGQAEALSRQQHAPNIKNVVAADQMGRFPDASAPEAVQRLPGVALQRDQGEGRYVQLRGSSAATTQVTVNGEQIGSPEADSRQIALDAIPVGVLAAVEVSKAITPDMDADAIGGSVNLVTKRAGQSRTFTLEGAGGFAPIRSMGSGLGAMTYGDRSGDGRLGWLFSGSFAERNFGSDDIEPDYDDDDLSELEVRHYSLWRRRTGATASVDFKLNDRSTFYVNSLWSELQDQEQRRVFAHLIEDDELSYAHKNRLEKIGSFNVLAGGEHKLQSGIGLDYRVGVTRSQEDTPFDREFEFLQEDVTFAPSRANPNQPQPNPAAGALAGTYLFDEFTTGSTLTRNRDIVGAVNLSVPISFGSDRTGMFRLGTKLRDKHKDQSVDAFEVGLDGDDIVLGSHLGGRNSNSGFAAGNYDMPWRTSASDVLDFESRFGNQLDSRELDLEAQTEAFDLSERVIAGYAMAELQLTPRLFVLPGVRFEHTALESNGSEYDDESETLSARTATNSYSNLFPMFHLRYSLSEMTNIRAAFTSTIFRPNFIDLVPYRIVDGEDIESGNPALNPTTARNYDLMVEQYDRNIGVLSVGTFFKQINNPIFVYTADNSIGGETSMPTNATSGRIFGMELAWQKRLTFLPGLLDGLGMYTNYTWTDSKATQPNGRETRLGGQAEHAWNVAVSYEKRGFSGQLSVNRVGRYIEELGEDADDDLHADHRTQIDLSASYFMTPTVQVYFEALNLGNAPYRTYQRVTDRLRQHEFYRPSMQAGLRFRP